MINQTNAPLRLFIANIVFVFLLTGCTVKQMEITESGFLSGYSGLEEDEDEKTKELRIYKNPDINIKERYSKILISPVQFKLDPLVKEHEMDYEDRKKMSDFYHEKLIEGLSENYEIVFEPGDGVLLFRSAITDVLPNKVYLNLHWSTTLIGGGIGGASLEAELVDSLTNERIMSFVDARKGKKLNYTKGLTKWGHTREVLGIWAKIMVTHLNELSDSNADPVDDY